MKYIFRYGFTLIEAIIVITILVILALISFLALQGYTSSARDSTRISDLKAMRKSFDMYIPYHGSLPFPDDALSVRICSYSGCSIGKEIGMQ
jgi:prepilin-type N-terminal cleavage/methylation domain-containing protein